MKIGNARKGMKHSERSKIQISEKKKGQIPWNKGHKGYTTKPASEERKRKIALAHIGKPKYGNRGEKSYLWKGGVTPENNKVRHSLEYTTWRRSVYERDDYTCGECGMRGRRLNADHIKPFSLYPELRFELSNGRTLCLNCHKKTDSYMNARKVQQIELL